MSADFWAGYLSGAVAIVIGNPLDVAKVRLQAQAGTPSPRPPPPSPRAAAASLLAGTAAPVLGYGALNALLFVSYRRSEAAINGLLATRDSLWATWLAGAVGGLSTWVVSTPTELVKCRAQVAAAGAAAGASSLAVARDVWRVGGVGGFYLGGTVTALRDAVGYGFYFWSYELATRCWPSASGHDGARILLCGGLAGMATWASVFPLDVVKTRLQTQAWGGAAGARRRGALAVAREALGQGGVAALFRGFTVCSLRAFVVNAVQWGVYEWAMGRAAAQVGLAE